MSNNVPIRLFLASLHTMAGWTGIPVNLNNLHKNISQIIISQGAKVPNRIFVYYGIAINSKNK